MTTYQERIFGAKCKSVFLSILEVLMVMVVTIPLVITQLFCLIIFVTLIFTFSIVRGRFGTVVMHMWVLSKLLSSKILITHCSFQLFLPCCQLVLITIAYITCSGYTARTSLLVFATGFYLVVFPLSPQLGSFPSNQNCSTYKYANFTTFDLWFDELNFVSVTTAQISTVGLVDSHWISVFHILAMSLVILLIDRQVFTAKDELGWKLITIWSFLLSSKLRDVRTLRVLSHSKVNKTRLRRCKISTLSFWEIFYQKLWLITSLILWTHPKWAESLAYC